MRKYGLFIFLALNFLIVIITPILFIEIGIYASVSGSMNQMLNHKNTEIVHSLGNEIAHYLQTIETQLSSLYDAVEGNMLKENSEQDFLDSFIANNPQIEMVQILNTEKRVIAVSPYDESYIDIDLSTIPAVHNSELGHNWSQTHLSPESGRPTITLAHLRESGGAVIYSKLENVSKQIFHSTDNEQGIAFLLDRDGTYITHPNQDLVMKRANLRSNTIIRQAIEKGVGFESSDLAGDDLLAVRVIEPANWIVVFQQPQSMAFAIMRNSQMIVIVLGFITMIIAFFLARYTLKETVPPLQDIVKAAKLASKGVYQTSILKSRIKEIAELSHFFNAMIMAIESRESELIDLRSYLTEVINSMPMALIGINENNYITHWNNRASDFFEIDKAKALGMPLSSVLDWFPEQLISESRNMNKTTELKKRGRKKEDGIHYENITVFPLLKESLNQAVILIEDVSRIVKIEEMLIQNEKMLTVGGLAAGVAHEINNPLAGIIQSSSVIQNRLSDLNKKANIKAAEEIGISMQAIQSYIEKRDIFRMLESISASGIRASEIVKEMLAFARTSHSDKQAYNISELISQTLSLLSTDYNIKKQYDFRSIEITERYQDNLPSVPCDHNKIQQVLMNIFTNGAQAMAEYKKENPSAPAPEFIITLETSNDNSYLRIEISDNGPGMNEETKKHIFDPFFTTKKIGKGTGLGLSLSYFIITENHGGNLFVKSTPGKGSSFIIELPLENN